MKGAREYAKLFKESGQYGKLWIEVGHHARGYTFKIYVLPEGLIIKDNGIWNYEDVVEVYGVISGTPGWTETYGWKYEGKWVDDFEAIVKLKRKQLKEKEAIEQKIKNNEAITNEAWIANLLAKY